MKPHIPLLLIVTALIACGDGPRADSESGLSAGLPEVVAVVEGHEITRHEIDGHFRQQMDDLEALPDSLDEEAKLGIYHELVDEAIVDHLLEKNAAGMEIDEAEVEENLAAFKAQFDDDETLAAELEALGLTPAQLADRIRSNLRQQNWLESQVAGKDAVTDEEARTFYGENTDAFEMPEVARASHILVAVPPDATAETAAEKQGEASVIGERVAKGEDFAALASELSQDPGSREAGGDLNYFTRDRMTPEFAQAAFALKVGEVSEPIRSRFGWHVIKLTDRKEARMVPFDEARERVVEYLQDEKRRELAMACIDALRAAADVKINLPPRPAPGDTGAEKPETE